jgi:DNA-binding IclR family transcriptional regulator
MTHIKVIKRTAQILDLFSLEKPEWGVGEVAGALGLPKSTTSELMSSLAHQRLLRHTAVKEEAADAVS